MSERVPDAGVLDRLYDVILSRKGSDPERSYSARLLASGRGRIARKMGEEALEVIVASLAESPKHVAAESADLLYHLLVLWADAGIRPEQVWAELAAREGVSGIDEKASRGCPK